MAESEQILDVYWEHPTGGRTLPALLAEGENLDTRLAENGHVLYMLLGRHPSAGANQLIYIGRSIDPPRRLSEHERWAALEPDELEVRLASVGEFETWEAWNEDERPRYPQASIEVVSFVEHLLIYSHQSPYNAKCLKTCPLLSDSHARVFNTGRSGPLLPEVSTRRYH